MSKNVLFSVGFKKKGDYKELDKLTNLNDRIDFNEENDKINNSHLYYSNGNRMPEHTEVTDIEIANNILKMINRTERIEENDILGISLVWCDNVVSLSVTIFSDNNHPNNFQVSSFVNIQKEQILANEIIDYLNSVVEDNNNKKQNKTHENKITVNFNNIVSELETKGLKLCFIKDNNSIFIIDTNNNMYQIETYRVGSYLDKLIKEGINVNFNYIDKSLSKNIAEWKKEIWDVSEVENFIKRQKLAQ
jgi:hypothetical protein